MDSYETAIPRSARRSDLAREAGITFIDGISQAIQQAEKAGAMVRARDGAHWNERGHQIAADRLVDYFVSRL
jgi:hypothetical protein